MILSDKDIRELVENYKDNNLIEPIISPFNQEYLQAASYDVTISDKINRLKSGIPSIDISKGSEVDSIYEEFQINDGCYIGSGECIMVTLNERICVPPTHVAHIRPRSKISRLGISINYQHCNPGYCGRLDLQVINNAPFAIRLTPNLKIAQVLFEELKSFASEDKIYSNKKDAAYHNEDDFVGSKISSELIKKAEEDFKNILTTLHK